MKKAIIITTCLGLLLFGSNHVYADETEKVGINTTKDIDQHFKISPYSHPLPTGVTEDDLFNITLTWKINPLNFEVANEQYEGSYIYNPLAGATSKQAIATFTITNNSFLSLKVDGSFENEEVFKNDTGNISYQFDTGKQGYLTGFLEKAPEENKECEFYVGGWKLLDGEHVRTITSTVTVNENLFKEYTGLPEGSIGTYHLTFSKAL